MTQTFKFYDLKFYDTQLTGCYCDNSHNGWILKHGKKQIRFLSHNNLWRYISCTVKSQIITTGPCECHFILLTLTSACNLHNIIHQQMFSQLVLLPHRWKPTPTNAATHQYLDFLLFAFRGWSFFWLLLISFDFTLPYTNFSVRSSLFFVGGF